MVNVQKMNELLKPEDESEEEFMKRVVRPCGSGKRLKQ